MKKEDIIYVTAQPDIPYFHWQVELYVHNFKKVGINPKNIHVIFSLDGYTSRPSESSKRLENLGCNIHFFKDERNNTSYVPNVKPFLVSKWLEKFPEYGKLFFLHDSDIIFRELPDFNKLLNDDISYLSDTIGYIGYNYLKNCCDRYEFHHNNSEKLQLLKEMSNVVGIDIDLIKENEQNSGGGQYLIKNTNHEIWNKIYLDCTPLYNQMLDYDKRFPIPSGQVQFWTAEMWATLWNLWKFNIKTKVVKELDFSWATDSLYAFDLSSILHMAGVTDDLKKEMFYKGDYVNINPIEMLRGNENYFDYINEKSITLKYIELMKDFIKS